MPHISLILVSINFENYYINVQKKSWLNYDKEGIFHTGKTDISYNTNNVHFFMLH